MRKGELRMVEYKVVWISGAARGIGYEIATTFARHGARVVLTDRDEQQLTTVIQQLQRDGLACEGQVCDVSSPSAVQEALEQVAATYGRIDVLINNAGFQHVASIEEFPVDTFQEMMQVMLVAPFVAMKTVFPIMKRQRWGRVINIASINGLVGFAGKAGYNSAKHGVIGLTKVAALEGAAHGITVNALCPGYVDTPLVRNQFEDLARNRQVPLSKVLDEVLYPLIPQKRLLSPREVADYALFLASEAARGITGQAIVIDGGYTAQ